MELKEFIKETLTAIIDGVVESQIFAKEKGAIIAPTKLKIEAERDKPNYGDVLSISPSNIGFDVVLTDRGVQSKGSGVGVSFGAFGADYKGSKGIENEQSTKISFSIPVFYPEQK